MSSTFFGLNIGWSALNAYSVSINTTANNVSNATTPGYSKQVTNLVPMASLRNYTYGTLGSGVDADSITNLRNTYYDVKYWTNNSNVGQYDKKIYYMSQIENYFRDDEESIKGFSSIYSDVFNMMDSLKGNAGDLDIRKHLINNAYSLTEYFNNMYSNLQEMQADCNQEVLALVSQINSYSQKISILNDKINTIEIHGARANELRDQRAYLIDQLSEIVPVEVEETEVRNSNYPDMYVGGTNYRVRVEGQLLVDGSNYNELECYARDEKVNQNDIAGLYDIRWSHTGNDFVATTDTMSGQLKAVFQIRDGNNRENLQGTVLRAEGSTLYVKDPNITTVEAMNMPDRGTITVANRSYTYSSFRLEHTVDALGNELDTYVFEIEDKDISTLAGKAGREVSVGRAVDARGIPYYLAQMNEFLRSFCRKFNDIQIYGSGDGTKDADGNMLSLDEDGNVIRYTLDENGNVIPTDIDYEGGGVDTGGNQMGAFFVAIRPGAGKENVFLDTHLSDGEKGIPITYRSDAKGGNYYQLTAGNVSVTKKSDDPNYFAASTRTDTDESEAGLVDSMLKLKSDVKVYRNSGGNQFLQYIIDDISVDANEADILYSNYADISSTIDTYRMSISSVDEDEEGLDLIKFQNAYNLASKIISTMNEMYDRLITQTGV